MSAARRSGGVCRLDRLLSWWRLRDGGGSGSKERCRRHANRKAPVRDSDLPWNRPKNHALWSADVTLNEFARRSLGQSSRNVTCMPSQRPTRSLPARSSRGGQLDHWTGGQNAALDFGEKPHTIEVFSSHAPDTHQVVVEDADGISELGGVHVIHFGVGEIHCVQPQPLAADGLFIQGIPPVLPRGHRVERALDVVRRVRTLPRATLPAADSYGSDVQACCPRSPPGSKARSRTSVGRTKPAQICGFWAARESQAVVLLAPVAPNLTRRTPLIPATAVLNGTPSPYLRTESTTGLVSDVASGGSMP